MLNNRPPFHTARNQSRGGFTLVELLVVIGIIAILAGVALGPITNGIKKAKQSSGMQTAHSIGLAMYSAANDNSQTYPDKSGGTAGDIGQALLAGGYVTDPSIFFVSGGKATKYSGVVASAATSIAQSNMSWDFGGNGGGGLVSTNYTYMPILWSTVAPAGGGTEPLLSSGATSAALIFANPGATNPFSTDGMAIYYINNSAKFLVSSVSGAVLQCSVVKTTDNTGDGPTTATVNIGGG